MRTKNKHMKQIIQSFFFVLVLSLAQKVSFSQVQDKDGRIYKTVNIGTQTWMAENLEVSHFRNGDLIPEVKSEDEWTKAGRDNKPAWCYYENDPAYGKKYGKLYNWFAINDVRGFAPEGWHVPDDNEWAQLFNQLGGAEKAGTKMKSTVEWVINKGTNSSGFSGRPGNSRNLIGKFLYEISADWWGTTEIDDEGNNVTGCSIYNHVPGAFMIRVDREAGLSVRLIKDQPKDYVSAGVDKYTNEDYEGAIADFDEAIKLNPASAEAYFNRGNAKDALDDFIGAIADYTKAISLSPDDAEVYLYRASTKHRMGKDAEAIIDYNKAILLEPQYMLAYWGRGEVKYNMKNYKDAIIDFTSAIKLYPEMEGPYYSRGLAKEQLDDYEGAILDYSKAIKCNPEYIAAYFNRGLIKQLQKKYSEALNDYNKVVEIDPDFAEVYANRGLMKLLTGDKAGGCADLKKAVELKDESAIGLVKDFCK